MEVIIDGASITDSRSFHAVFVETLGFPAFYGNNFNAWIDCMGYVDDDQAEMSKVHVSPGKQLTIQVINAEKWKQRSPDVWLTFLECAAFVNWRRIEARGEALLIISACA